MTALAQGTMPLLHALAGIRVPILDTILGALTYLGDETLFIVVGLLFFWCVNKRCGYYLLTVGISGTAINQFLKLIFRVPRPWLLDESHTIVESAREGASGWSFPSGHTQNAVGTYSGIALWTKKRWLKVLCVVIAVLVSFSRMYLGVHTILDVGVSVVVALALALCLRPLFMNGSASTVRRVLIVNLVLCGALLGAAYLLPGLDALTGEDLANRNDGFRALWLLLAASIGFLAVFEVDERHTHFDTKAVWWAQLLKLALGLGITFGIKTMLKKLFGAAYHDALPTFVTYLCMFLFAGCIWPMTFRFFSRLGQETVTKA